MKEGDGIIAGSRVGTQDGDALGMLDVEAGVIAFREGQWLYRGLWARLFRALQQTYVSRLQRAGFEEWVFPRLMPVDALDSFELTQFRPGMLFSVFGSDTETAIGMLDPVQCLPLYKHLSAEGVRSEELPLKVTESLGGWTWRNETVEELRGPLRAREFARVEAVFIGTPEQVVETRRAVRDEIIGLFEDLALPWRVVVGVGCMEIPELTDRLATATAQDDVPVQDVELQLAGTEWLEVAGCTVEGRHLIESFGIAASDGEPIWSGCCGLGINRVIAGLLIHHSNDLTNWPDEVLATLGIGDAVTMR